MFGGLGGFGGFGDDEFNKTVSERGRLLYDREKAFDTANHLWTKLLAGIYSLDFDEMQFALRRLPEALKRCCITSKQYNDKFGKSDPYRNPR